MAFALGQFLRYRPHLYHLTAGENLKSIVSTQKLRCANALLEEAGLLRQAVLRREEHLRVRTNEGTMLIRDQKPLVSGAIEFEEGWDLMRFVEYVNQHVFFWPGTAVGPINPGLNHFQRYRAECPVILRIATEDADPNSLRFSRYNSGAPRCSGGKYSPRGSITYLAANEFPGTASEVIEVVATGEFALPTNVEMSFDLALTWKPLQNTG